MANCGTLFYCSNHTSNIPFVLLRDLHCIKTPTTKSKRGFLLCNWWIFFSSKTLYLNCRVLTKELTALHDLFCLKNCKMLKNKPEQILPSRGLRRLLFGFSQFALIYHPLSRRRTAVFKTVGKWPSVDTGMARWLSLSRDMVSLWEINSVFTLSVSFTPSMEKR